jgi:mRNA interferase MazF
MPPPMTIYDPFDVVVVPFPFTDKAKQKPRPALVISSRGFNASHGQVILLMITTAGRTKWMSDVPITDLNNAGLTAASVVRFKCFTLEESIVTRRIGAVSKQDRVAASARLQQILVH